ncbi:TPA: hypothetical protein ACH3X2_001203 [Trebouxia sp. C0005]
MVTMGSYGPPHLCCTKKWLMPPMTASLTCNMHPENHTTYPWTIHFAAVLLFCAGETCMWFVQSRMHEFFGLGTTHLTEVNEDGTKEVTKLRVHSLLVTMSNGKACVFWKEFTRDDIWLPIQGGGWPVFKENVDLDMETLTDMPTKPITEMDDVEKRVKACLKLWQSWLGANQTTEQGLSSHNQERLDKQRESRTSAIKFWDSWLLDVHKERDGKDEQTCLLPPSQKLLPDALYKQAVPSPPGMSEVILLSQ